MIKLGFNVLIFHRLKFCILFSLKKNGSLRVKLLDGIIVACTESILMQLWYFLQMCFLIAIGSFSYL